MSVFWACAVTPYFAIATFADGLLGDIGMKGLMRGMKGMMGARGGGMPFR